MEGDVIRFRYEKKKKSIFFSCRFAVSVFVIAFLIVMFARQSYLFDRSIKQTIDFSEFIFLTKNVTKSLAAERGVTSMYLGSGERVMWDRICRNRNMTDVAMNELKVFLGKHYVKENFLSEIPEFVSSLQSIRVRVEEHNIDEIENIEVYSKIIFEILDNIVHIQTGYGDLSKVGYALYNFFLLQENLGGMRGVLGYISAQGHFDPEMRKIVIGYSYREKLYLDSLIRLFPEIQSIWDSYNEKIEIKIANEYVNGVVEIIEEAENFTISTNPNLLFDWMFNLIDKQVSIQTFLTDKLDSYVEDHNQNFYFQFFGFLGCIILEISALSWVICLTFPSLKKNWRKGRPWGQIDVVRDTILMDLSQEKSY